MMKDNTLVICLPTHNRHERIEKLKPFFEVCGQNDIDIIIYDSSDEKMSKEGFSDNVKIIDLDSSYKYKDKILHIFQDRENLSVYDYMFILKDGSYYNIEMLVQIRNFLKSSNLTVDVFHLNTIEPETGTSTIPVTAIDFYEKYGFLTGSVETTCYNISTFMDNFNKNIEYDEHWTHYQILYTTLANLKNPNIQVFCKKDSIYSINEELSTQINPDMWWKIAKDAWIDMNLKLPCCYDPYKLHNIKYNNQMRQHIDSIGMRYSILELKLINKNNLEDCLKNFNLISNCSYDIITSLVQML